MENNKNYVKYIRDRVGHDKVILVCAGGCVFNDAGEILLQKRGDRNQWGLPGGVLELGETPQAAAIREIKEETGLDVEIRSLIGVYSDPDVHFSNGDEAHTILVAYVCRIVGGELYCDGEETLELQYFALDDLPPLFCKQHEDTVMDCKSLLN